MSDLMQTFPVRSVIAHHAGLKTFAFDPVIPAEPGQFIMLWLPGVDEKPFALSWRDAREMHVTIRAVGPMTQRLMETQPGDRLGLRGPFGRGFSPQPSPLTLLLVGGGCGNAPLRFLAQRLAEDGRPFRWIAAVKQRCDLLFASADGASSAAPPQACGDILATFPQLIAVSEDGSIGRQGLAMDAVRTAVEAGPPAEILAAGPEGLLLALRDFARARNIPVQLSFERYMKCGIGLCGQCCLDGSGDRVCVEGPVFTEERLNLVTEWGLPPRGPSGRRPTTL